MIPKVFSTFKGFVLFCLLLSGRTQSKVNNGPELMPRKVFLSIAKSKETH